LAALVVTCSLARDDQRFGGIRGLMEAMQHLYLEDRDDTFVGNHEHGVTTQKTTDDLKPQKPHPTQDNK
jgi:hypothetical protein